MKSPSGDDMDAKSLALAKKLMEEDLSAMPSRSRRDRRAPELYKPPPPGVGTLLKSDKPSSTASNKDGGEGGARQTREQRPGGSTHPASTQSPRMSTHGTGGSSAKGKSGPAPTSAGSGASGGADKRRRASDPALGHGGGRKSAEGGKLNAGGGGLGLRLIGVGTPPPGVKHPGGRFKYHKAEVWVQSTQRPSGGEHYDHIFKRFDPEGVELIFEKCDSKGFPSDSDSRSLRSTVAVDRYLERAAAAKTAVKQPQSQPSSRRERDTGSRVTSRTSPHPAAVTAAPTAAKQAPCASPASAPPAKSQRRWSEPLKLTKASADTYLLRGGKETTKTEIHRYVDNGGKGCHQCKERTINLPCSNKNEKTGYSCFMTYCTPCYETYYSYLTPQQLCTKCPKCLLTCVCRKCIREFPLNIEECKAFTNADAATREKHAKHTLKALSAHFVDVKEQLESERRAHVTPGADAEVPQMLPGGTYRLVCDRCSGAIADCHRNCAQCSSDYCLECCAEMRLLPHYRASASLRPEIKRWGGDVQCFEVVPKVEPETSAKLEEVTGNGIDRARGAVESSCGEGSPAKAKGLKEKGIEEMGVTAKGAVGEVRSLPAAAEESAKAVVVKCPTCIDAAHVALASAQERLEYVENNGDAAIAAAAETTKPGEAVPNITRLRAEAESMIAAAQAKCAKAQETELKLKVRSISVTGAQSLALAKAMEDPLDDIKDLAERYGGPALRRRQQEVDDLTNEFTKHAKEVTEKLLKEVFDNPEEGPRKLPTRGATAERKSEGGGAGAGSGGGEPAAACAPHSQAWRIALEKREAGEASAEVAHRLAIKRRRDAARPEAPCTHCTSGRPKRATGSISSAGLGTCEAMSLPEDSLPIWRPHADDVNPTKLGPVKYAAVLTHFQSHWARGDPVVVRGVKGHYTGCWSPKVITRAMAEAGSSAQVYDCESDVTNVESITRFFRAFSEPEYAEKSGMEMVKIKDWPAEDDFKQKMPRHYKDFIQMLPFQEYTNSLDGLLNLSTKLPKEWVPPDLGPKSYIATGRKKEHGFGDSVSRLHQDMSDAVNILVHTGPAQREPEGSDIGDEPESGMSDDEDKDGDAVAGAQWEIFRREDVPTLTEWLSWKWCKGELEYQQQVKELLDKKRPRVILRNQHPIHDQMTYLTQSDLAQLHKDTGIKPWSFIQHLGDAVFIPGGCPHQVRNLRSCLKVAVDFVSPESAGTCLIMARQLRGCNYEDKLQGRAMILHAGLAADEVLNGGKRRFYCEAMEAATMEAKRAMEAERMVAAATEGGNAAVVKEEEVTVGTDARLREPNGSKAHGKGEPDDTRAGADAKEDTAAATTSNAATTSKAAAFAAAKAAAKAAAAEAAAAEEAKVKAEVDNELDDAADLLCMFSSKSEEPTVEMDGKAGGSKRSRGGGDKDAGGMAPQAPPAVSTIGSSEPGERPPPLKKLRTKTKEASPKVEDLNLAAAAMADAYANACANVAFNPMLPISGSYPFAAGNSNRPPLSAMELMSQISQIRSPSPAVSAPMMNSAAAGAARLEGQRGTLTGAPSFFGPSGSAAGVSLPPGGDSRFGRGAPAGFPTLTPSLPVQPPTFMNNPYMAAAALNLNATQRPANTLSAADMMAQVLMRGGGLAQQNMIAAYTSQLQRSLQQAQQQAQPPQQQPPQDEDPNAAKWLGG